MSTKHANRRTLDQERAEHALERIREIRGKNDGYYISYVSALPASIVMNGLGQALVTQLAKSKKDASTDSHHLLYTHVASWLSRQIQELHVPSENDLTMVIDRMMAADQQIYLRAQAEAMAYLNWLKQFARAYLEEKGGAT